jgi:hypothetical protein
MTDHMMAALRLAASRKSGLVSGGHGFPTPMPALRALSKRGLLQHVATATTGPHRQRHQYKLTEQGRAVAAQLGQLGQLGGAPIGISGGILLLATLGIAGAVIYGFSGAGAFESKRGNHDRDYYRRRHARRHGRS